MPAREVLETAYAAVAYECAEAEGKARQLHPFDPEHFRLTEEGFRHAVELK